MTKKFVRNLGDAGYVKAHKPAPIIVPQGQRFTGRKGEYILKQDLGPEMEVYYVTGELKGQTVRMNKGLHQRMIENVSRDTDWKNKHELELWYQYYWPLVDSAKEKGMQGTELLEVLRARHPQAAFDLKRMVEEDFRR